MASTLQAPRGELVREYSSPDGRTTTWTDAVRVLDAAMVSWVSTVRRDGRPHVTPLATVWLDGSVYFSTGPREQKAKNLERNASCVMTTGTNRMDGIDVVVEGTAVRVLDQRRLERLAAAYHGKYGSLFAYTARDGMLRGADGNAADVFEVEPRKVFAFAKGEHFSQTRWRF